MSRLVSLRGRPSERAMTVGKERFARPVGGVAMPASPRRKIGVAFTRPTQEHLKTRSQQNSALHSLGGARSTLRIGTSESALASSGGLTSTSDNPWKRAESVDGLVALQAPSGRPPKPVDLLKPAGDPVPTGWH